MSLSSVYEIVILIPCSLEHRAESIYNTTRTELYINILRRCITKLEQVCVVVKQQPCILRSVRFKIWSRHWLL